MLSFVLSGDPSLQWVCNSSSVQGRLLCPVRCSVKSLACFPLSGSSLSRRCSISGVNGIGSLPMLLRALECVHEAPDSEPNDRRSLSLLFDPLPCSAIGPNLLLRGTPVPVGSASGALFALFPVTMVSHVLRGGHGAPKLRRVAIAGAVACPCGGVVAATVGDVSPGGFSVDPQCWGVLAAVDLESLGVVGAAPVHPFPRLY